MNKKIKTILAMSLVFAACTSAEKIDNKQEVEKTKIENKMEGEVKQGAKEIGVIASKGTLVGSEFVLSTNRAITLGFDKERIFGSTGINRFFGNYDIKNGQLIVKYVGVTLAAGSNQQRIEEFKILGALEENKVMRVDSNKLIMTDKYGASIEFIKVK